jgi:aspartate carbamoyltransferase catalytic subunit
MTITSLGKVTDTGSAATRLTTDTTIVACAFAPSTRTRAS